MNWLEIVLVVIMGLTVLLQHIGYQRLINDNEIKAENEWKALITRMNNNNKGNENA